MGKTNKFLADLVLSASSNFARRRFPTNVAKRAAKEISGLQSEVAGLTERINLQADVTEAMEKECEALRSTVTTRVSSFRNKRGREACTFRL